MSSLFSDMKRRADEVALEADKKIRITRKQGEINDVRKQIRQQTTQLGDLAYGLHAQGQSLPTPLTDVGKAIDNLYAAIKAKEAEIESIRREQLSPVGIPETTTCHVCHQPLPPNAAFCLHCGSPKVEPDPMVPCPHCQNMLPVEARFCAHCGQSTVAQQPPDTIACSHCAAVLPATALFCPECGTHVAQVSESASTPIEPQTIEVEPLRCRECGASLDDDAIFCVECGTPAEEEIEVEPEMVVEIESSLTLDEDIELDADVNEMLDEPVTKKYCSVCAAEVPADAVFCEICGAAIE